MKFLETHGVSFFLETSHRPILVCSILIVVSSLGCSDLFQGSIAKRDFLLNMNINHGNTLMGEHSYIYVENRDTMHYWLCLINGWQPGSVGRTGARPVPWFESLMFHMLASQMSSMPQVARCAYQLRPATTGCLSWCITFWHNVWS